MKQHSLSVTKSTGNAVKKTKRSHWEDCLGTEKQQRERQTFQVETKQHIINHNDEGLQNVIRPESLVNKDTEVSVDTLWLDCEEIKHTLQPTFLELVAN